MQKKKTTYQFIEDAKKIYGNQYDYSEVEYINSRKKIIIICPKHGKFEIKPLDHLRKKCFKCANNIPTTEEYIEQAKEIHNDIYDYSKTEYINSKSNITIICQKHGEFHINPYNHIKYKQGCNKCNSAKEKVSIPKVNDMKRNRYTTETFINVSTKIHGDKYNYSKVIYTVGMDKIIIICREHGEFLIQARKHLQGQGCKKCSGSWDYSSEEFIKKANKIHNNKYNYSYTKYNGCRELVTIICKEHGKFEQLASSHLTGRGCIKCGNNYIPTTEEWIKKAKNVHGNKYDYTKTDYVKNKEKIIIICKEHGEFYQQPSEHIRGYGCIKCSGKYQYTNEEFIEKANNIHNNLYDYSKTKYTTSDQKVIIICKEHNEFKQSPDHHLKGQGCPKCAIELVSRTNLLSCDDFIRKAKLIHKEKYNYSEIEYKGCHEKVKIICKKHGSFLQRASDHIYNGAGCSKCLLCPKCLLWRTCGKLCQYCKPKNKNKLYQKTKEMDVVKYLREKLPDTNFIHNKSVGTECTEGHFFPDIRFDCLWFQLIIEVDEYKHRSANYQCDEKRMYDITAKLGQPCIFIRYNPDSKESNKGKLLEKIQYYLDLQNIYMDEDFDKKIYKELNQDTYYYEKLGIDNLLGFKTEYLFYEN